MPINTKLYDHNIEFSCDTADNQQHEEELIRIANGQSSPSIYMEGPQYRYVWSAMQAYMPATPYVK
jgi:hypothetical protein